MRVATRVVLLISFLCTVSSGLAQVTNGKPPALPRPYTKPIAANPAKVAPAPGVLPKAPPGFTVSLFARGFREPRWLAVAPNGDVFVTDMLGAKIWVLH